MVNTVGVQTALGKLLFTAGVLDELIWNSQLSQWDSDAVRGQGFRHGAAGATADSIIFQRDQQVVAGGHVTDTGFVQRFDQAR